MLSAPVLRIVLGVPPPKGDHARFDQLAARPECIAAYSLRDQAQLVEHMDHDRWFDVTYDPQNDPDPRRQDAAKIVIPANVVSLPNNVRVPIPAVGTDSLTAYWESWLGAEYVYGSGGGEIARFKHFQFASPNRIWTEIRSVFIDAKIKAGRRYVAVDPDEIRAAGGRLDDIVYHRIARRVGAQAVARLDVRSYGQTAADVDHQFAGMLGPNVTDNNPLSPQAAEFGILPETWTRYCAAFEPDGEWLRFRLWLADGTRAPVLTHDRLQMKPNPNAELGHPFEKFWLEYNSSSNRPPNHARVAYCRNIVMMRGVDPLTIVQ